MTYLPKNINEFPNDMNKNFDTNRISQSIIEGFSYQTQRDTKQKVRMQILSNPKMLRPFRNFIFDISLAYGISRDKAYDLKIIASEIMSNLIQKNHLKKFDDWIFFEYLFYTTYVEMRFRDFKFLLKKEEWIPKDLKEFRESGISLYLISKLSDYYYWEELQNKGILFVIKKRL